MCTLGGRAGCGCPTAYQPFTSHLPVAYPLLIIFISAEYVLIRSIVAGTEDPATHQPLAELKVKEQVEDAAKVRLTAQGRTASFVSRFLWEI